MTPQKEHIVYTIPDWRYALQQGHTGSSYEDWVDEKVAAHPPKLAAAEVMKRYADGAKAVGPAAGDKEFPIIQWHIECRKDPTTPEYEVWLAQKKAKAEQVEKDLATAEAARTVRSRWRTPKPIQQEIDFDAPASDAATIWDGPEAVALVDAMKASSSVVDIDKAEMVMINTSTGEPRTDARRLHTKLGNQRKFPDWFKQRTEECDLVKGQDYGVCVTNLGSKECGVESKGRGGSNAIDYWLTLDAAKEMAMMERNEQGKAIRRYLIDVEKKWRAQQAQPVAIDFNDLDTVRKLYLASDDARVVAEQKVAVVTEEKAQAVAERTQAENTAADMARQRSREERAIPVSEWFNNTASDHGHGSISGCKTMRALGLMTRANVKGCRYTKESRATAEMTANGVLFMSSSNFEKTRKNKKNPLAPAAPVLDSNGKQVIGTSRVVLLDPDIGAAWMMNWMLTRPECQLRRYIQQRPDDVILKRLTGRYSFMHYNNHALDELNEVERDQCIRMFDEGEDGWAVKCNVKAPKGKGGFTYIATGRGRTLEEAYYDLADRYCLPAQVGRLHQCHGDVKGDREGMVWLRAKRYD